MTNLIDLATIPAKRFLWLKDQLIEEFEIYLGQNFIDAKTDVPIEVFLRLMRLSNYENFQQELANRSEGLFKFIDGKAADYIELSSKSEFPNLLSVDEPLPYIGKFRLEILEDLQFRVDKSDREFTITFNRSVFTFFKKPAINRELRKQFLRKLIITDTKFEYIFENDDPTKQGVRVLFDLLKEDPQLKLANTSKMLFGSCFPSGGGGGGATVDTLGTLELDQGSTIKTLNVVVEKDVRISIELSKIVTVNEITVRYSRPDKYGKTYDKVNVRNTSREVISTRFDKGPLEVEFKVWAPLIGWSVLAVIKSIKS